MMCSRQQRLALLALLGLGLLLAGCGPKGKRYPETGATLEGTVKYGEDTVGVALVIAQNDSGSATAFVDDNGRYKLVNVPLGEVNLAVNTEAGKGQAQGRFMAQSQGQGQAAPKIVDVPKEYFEPSTSGIKTTIKKGENRYDIVIPR
jgi:hypothetical protein